MTPASRTDFTDVREFHVKFGLPFDDAPNPIALDADAYRFRVGFLYEEIDEYGEAWAGRDLTKAVDALLDFVYVIYGTALFMRAGRVHPGLAWPSSDGVAAYAGPRGYLANPSPVPALLPAPINDLVTRRMHNEVELFELAHQVGDESSTVLALSHLWNAAFAAYFTAVRMSVPWDACWRHVQEANLAKRRAAADGSDSKRRTPWDVVKPAGWVPPDFAIARELAAFGADLNREAA